MPPDHNSKHVAPPGGAVCARAWHCTQTHADLGDSRAILDAQADATAHAEARAATAENRVGDAWGILLDAARDGTLCPGAQRLVLRLAAALLGDTP